jgi:hypothetical protein
MAPWLVLSWEYCTIRHGVYSVCYSSVSWGRMYFRRGTLVRAVAATGTWGLISSGSELRLVEPWQ